MDDGNFNKRSLNACRILIIYDKIKNIRVVNTYSYCEYIKNNIFRTGRYPAYYYNRFNVNTANNEFVFIFQEDGRKEEEKSV